VIEETYAQFDSNGGRKASPRKGLPQMADIEKVAGVWLNQQSKLWPELVALGVLPEKSPDVIRQLAESFEQDSRISRSPIRRRTTDCPAAHDSKKHHPQYTAPACPGDHQ